MATSEILSANAHRPWPLPANQWQFYQEWNDAVFIHWPIAKNILAPYLPKDLEIDTFEGQAWISIVAFSMEKVRPRLLPHFSPISNFNEVNIRTYVKYRGKSAVYFLSIEAGKRLSAFFAKTLSGLPYRYSKMKREMGRYESSNTKYKDRLLIEYAKAQVVFQKSELDYWLTERYGLVQDIKGKIVAFEIHHIEWPLHHIEISELVVDYPRFSSLFQGSPPLLHYSPGVQVLTWGKSESEYSQ